MEFCSTRDAGARLGFAAALRRGLAPDGGLYVPVSWPTFDAASALADELSLPAVAGRFIAPFAAGAACAGAAWRAAGGGTVRGPNSGIDARGTHLRISQTRLRYNLIFHPIRHFTPEVILDDEDLFVRTVVLNHRIPCTGFVFTEKPRPRKLKTDKLTEYHIPFSAYTRIKRGDAFADSEGRIIPNDELTEAPAPPRTYAYCSDTAFLPELAKQVSQANILYHEATFLHEMKTRATATYHSTSKEAAEIAQMAEVDKLVIGHFSARYKQLDELLEEARTVFPNTELAIEGASFVVD
jgi:ribonuclease Z